MEGEDTSFGWRQRLGFPLGLAVLALVLFLPSPSALSLEAQRAAAVACLMAVWWITECFPIAVTALVPLAAYPLLSILNATETARRYADPNVFLFMGGFMIALAMQKWGLHKRIALQVIRWVGGSSSRMLAGFLSSTAFISMWVSNTATAVLMLPIGMAVIGQWGVGESREKSRFGEALMLGIAYACSIGGIATLIGSPPNMIFAGQSKALFPEMGEVGFLHWILFAFPLALGFLILVWGYLSFVVMGNRALPGDQKNRMEAEIRALGPWSKGEVGVLAVFLLTALAWIWREDLAIGSFRLSGWTTLLGLKGVHDGTVAITAALLLFAIPVSLRKGEFLLDWKTAVQLPWGVLLLFGGGFALAESFRVTGLDQWLGGNLEIFKNTPLPLLVLILCLVTTFSSELMSNTAQVSLLTPVLAAAAPVLGVHPYVLMIPATIAASFAFMLPVGTPPNAIVFGSGLLTIPKMVKAGFVLNLLGALWITFMTLIWMETAFDLKGVLP